MGRFEGKVPKVTGKATYHLHPEDAEAYKGVVAKMADEGSRQPGCLFFNAAQDAGQPTTFYLFEGWESFDSVLAFHATDSFKALAKEAMALRITERYGDVFDVTGVQDMQMP